LADPQDGSTQQESIQSKKTEKKKESGPNNHFPKVSFENEGVDIYWLGGIGPSRQHLNYLAISN
jgi:hypothetical protein